ncbi:tetratricopeptide repeat protein [Rhodoferax mekongensis]|uniref:tetratricopeptide repeat protein n=1 Tax=Rhodoferax mekongensis TaxID=3068341 RepID=UPI0028BEC8D0|nr:tetratricopeptide repeat protein [Rhodoferax sp. TBRC 17199]MDT7516271.1 tetratricopeptide repeat protein [Rhodoferax sp. TBRC 17199]
MNKSIWKWALVLGMVAGSAAWAQQEPSLNEIYATAQAGKLEQAQVMVQQVLVSHPNSAKAHYVRSELYARQGQLASARESLAKAEKLAPGLPFAKPEAVQALRSQLAGSQGSAAVAHTNAAPVAYSSPAPSSSGGWVLPVLLAGGVMALAFFAFRRRTPDVQVLQPAYGSSMGGGLSGPQTFGSPAPNPYAPQPYGPTYGAGYGQATGSGLGGKIMGGVATGLAVGAGVMAAEAIGRNLMGGHDTLREQFNVGNPIPDSSYLNNDINRDMGGADFGINDSTTWDDPGVSGDSSSDWDT